MSFLQLILGGVSNASSIITGAIVSYLGWHYLFHMLIAFVTFHIILLVLFVPETQYRRDHRYETDELIQDDLKDLAEVEQRHGEKIEYASSGNGLEQVNTASTTHTFMTPPPKKTWAQELALFSGTYSDENLLQLLIAPFAVCLNLVVAWNVIVTGTITATYVAGMHLPSSSKFTY